VQETSEARSHDAETCDFEDPASTSNMVDTSVPKAMEGLTISKTKELKGTEKRDALIEIEKVRLGCRK
jgi:hypothetical protein